MGNLAIKVDNLGKMYYIGGPQEKYQTFRDTITRVITTPFKRARDLLRGQAYGAAGLTEEIWALKDISFEVKHGEVVGIIGRNGAGKSTLLKILSRITEPSTGYADIYGRVGALLEVGTGFHPELTGRENVYLNGAILGMSRSDINRKFDEIVEFAGIMRFIDTPVKFYSSGMGLRLGFSVAAHLEPEILIVDEVLAVGDAQFQKKCLGKMSDVAGEGRTVLFVSHNMAAMANLCSHGMVLRNGQVSFWGNTDEAINEYLHMSSRQDHILLKHIEDRRGNGRVRATEIILQTGDGISTDVFGIGATMCVILSYEINNEVALGTTMMVNIGIVDAYQNSVLLFSNYTTQDILTNWPTKGQIKCNIGQLPLAAGTYSITIFIKAGEEIADWVTNTASFTIENADFYGTGQLPPPSHAKFHVKHSWSIDDI